METGAAGADPGLWGPLGIPGAAPRPGGIWVVVSRSRLFFFFFLFGPTQSWEFVS